MAKTHEYPVRVTWKGGRDGSGDVTDQRGNITVPLTTPPEFGGTGAGTNPEQLLAMSVAACYTITLGIVLTNRKVPFADIQADVVGEVLENGPSFTYTKLTIRPRVVLTGADDAQAKVAEDMAHKADAYCIITNAVREKVQVVVEPVIVRT
ncbi:MAG: OsmC family protein [Armatimonadetes bacterium]|nr:OsmC family protein [Armatimonadota bacterium]